MFELLCLCLLLLSFVFVLSLIQKFNESIDINFDDTNVQNAIDNMITQANKTIDEDISINLNTILTKLNNQ